MEETEHAIKVPREGRRGLAAGCGGSVVVLLLAVGAASWLHGRARKQTDDVRSKTEAVRSQTTAVEAEQSQLRREVAEAHVASARLAMRDDRVDDASADLASALALTPSLPEARLLKGLLLIAQRKYEAALRGDGLPSGPVADALANLCRRAQRQDTWETRREFVQFFIDEGAPRLAQRFADTNEELLEVCRAQIAAAWPERGGKPVSSGIDEEGLLTIHLAGWPYAADLSPLRGMPIKHLDLRETQARDLSPLVGLPLVHLDIRGTKVDDLTPLKGMRLESLNLYNLTRVSDIRVLAGMPLRDLNLSLTRARDLSPLAGAPLVSLDINGTGATDLSPLKGAPLRTLSANLCGIADLSPLQGMPLETLSFHQATFRDLSPLKGAPLKLLYLDTCQFIRTLEPLRGAAIEDLSLSHCYALEDISAVEGMPLRRIRMTHCRSLKSLHGLEGLKFTGLNLRGCSALEDIRALKDMPLRAIELRECRSLKSLHGLEGMPFKELHLSSCSSLTDISAITTMKVTALHLCGCQSLTDFSPLKGTELQHLNVQHFRNFKSLDVLRDLPLRRLVMHGTPVEDLTPLAGMDLELLFFSPIMITKGIEVLRAMKSLKEININGHRKLTPEEFWKAYDAGEFQPKKAPPPRADAGPPPAPRADAGLPPRPEPEALSPVAQLRKNLQAGGAKLRGVRTEGDRVLGVTLFGDGAIPVETLRDAEVREVTVVRGGMTDLQGLAGLPLESLNLDGAPKLRDLSGLDEVRPKRLRLHRCTALRGLEPLKGLPIEELNLSYSRFGSLEPLKELPLTKLNLTHTHFDGGFGPLRGLKLKEFVLPNTDFRDSSVLRGMPLEVLELSGNQNLWDITPLRGAPLRRLHLGWTDVPSLEPLRGMRLAELNACSNRNLTDLSPLKGMPLVSLDITNCPRIRDLSPLRGMPLKWLSIVSTSVADLTPLTGLKLEFLHLSPERIEKGLDVLREMKSLRHVQVSLRKGDQMTAAEFWRRYDAGEWNEAREKWRAERDRILAREKATRIKAIRVADAVTVDGKIGEREYGQAPRNASFLDFKTHEPAPRKTELAVVYDDDRLYLLIVGSEENPGDVLKRQVKGKVWNAGYVELFIDASHDRMSYVQFAFNYLTDRYDGLCGPGKKKGGDGDWETEWRFDVGQTDKAIVCEVAIPFASLGVEPPEPGATWGLNVIRGDGEFHVEWVNTYGDHHSPGLFGIVEFLQE